MIPDIKVTDKWHLSGSEYEVTLYKRRFNKKAKGYEYRAVGFYPNWGSALKGLIDKDINPLKSHELIVERLEVLHEAIDKALKELSIYVKPVNEFLNHRRPNDKTT